MKFADSEYARDIGRISMSTIAIGLYLDGYRQTSSRYAILTREGHPDDVLTDCGCALVKAVRKQEKLHAK